MPVVKKGPTKALAKPAAKPSLIKKRKNPDDDLEIVLPTKPAEIATDIGDFTFLIYGSKKIGKTSLAARFPKALAFMFEPGGKALQLMQISCPAWGHFKQSIDKLEEKFRKEGELLYKTFIVDTASLAYDTCMNYTCAKADIEHPSDEGFGKGWKRVTNELSQQFVRLQSMDAGLIALAHDKIVRIETKSGRAYDKVMPTLSGQAEEYFAGTIDVIGYYYIEDGQRWLQIREDDFVMAGCRPENNFRTTSGDPIFKIPMGSSAKEAYENLVKAFKNQQKESYAPKNASQPKTFTSTKTSTFKKK